MKATCKRRNKRHARKHMVHLIAECGLAEARTRFMKEFKSVDAGANIGDSAF